MFEVEIQRIVKHLSLPGTATVIGIDSEYGFSKACIFCNVHFPLSAIDHPHEVFCIVTAARAITGKVVLTSTN